MQTWNCCKTNSCKCPQIRETMPRKGGTIPRPALSSEQWGLQRGHTHTSPSHTPSPWNVTPEATYRVMGQIRVAVVTVKPARGREEERRRSSRVTTQKEPLPARAPPPRPHRRPTTALLGQGAHTPGLPPSPSHPLSHQEFQGSGHELLTSLQDRRCQHPQPSGPGSTHLGMLPVVRPVDAPLPPPGSDAEDARRRRGSATRPPPLLQRSPMEAISSRPSKVAGNGGCLRVPTRLNPCQFILILDASGNTLFGGCGFFFSPDIRLCASSWHKH